MSNVSKELANIRRKLKNGEIVTCFTITSTDPAIAELVGLAGFDFAWIDAEHAALSLADVQRLLIGARAGGAAGIVRVTDHSTSLVKQILDMGPDGIIFPMINTAQDAKDCVAKCLYPPRGVRGFNPLRASNHGLIGYKDIGLNDHENILRMMTIEQREGINNIEEIVKVEGVDALILGPGDLSFDMGYSGDLSNPEVQGALKHAAEVCKAAGMPFLAFPVPWDSVESMKTWIKRGASYFSFGVDIQTLAQHIKKTYLPALDRAIKELKEEGGA